MEFTKLNSKALSGWAAVATCIQDKYKHNTFMFVLGLYYFVDSNQKCIRNQHISINKTLIKAPSVRSQKSCTQIKNLGDHGNNDGFPHVQVPK